MNRKRRIIVKMLIKAKIGIKEAKEKRGGNRGYNNGKSKNRKGE